VKKFVCPVPDCGLDATLKLGAIEEVWGRVGEPPPRIPSLEVQRSFLVVCPIHGGPGRWRGDIT
jgi:hypothetical protein